MFARQPLPRPLTAAPLKVEPPLPLINRLCYSLGNISIVSMSDFTPLLAHYTYAKSLLFCEQFLPQLQRLLSKGWLYGLVDPAIGLNLWVT